MSIRAIRLCHHCDVPLSADEVVHYVFECHICVVADHDLEAAARRDPSHPEAPRLACRAVDTASPSAGRGVPARAAFADDALADCA